MRFRLSRRHFIAGMTAAGLGIRVPALLAQSEPGVRTREIPSSGESLPVIGMGTWRTFNVGEDRELVNQRTRVLKTFLELGGTLIDSSPMYGSADDVLGLALPALESRDRVFAATKIWTGDEGATREQAEASRSKWQVARFDLLQVHNLLGWEGHLETLKAMKAEGEVRYLGITTSHGRRHQDFERLMTSEPLDFVQLTYNLLDREAEERLLPLARERGIAVIVNRPFQGGRLFRQFDSEPLPSWAAEIGCKNWAEFFLKYIVSHPAVTCAIPATSRVDHMRENMGALYGPLPDASRRASMARYVRNL